MKRAQKAEAELAAARPLLEAVFKWLDDVGSDDTANYWLIKAALAYRRAKEVK